MTNASTLRGCFTALASILCATSFALGDGKVHMFFCDIGQGDGTLIVGPQGTSVLIDGGPSSSVGSITGAMNWAIGAGLTDNKLDYVVASHFHADHIGGLDNAYLAFPGGLIKAYDRGGAYSSQAYTDYDNTFGAPGLNKRGAAVTFSIGTGCSMVYVGKGTAGTGDENNNGVLYRLEYGSFKASLAGDLGGTYETNFAGSMGNIDHYKANHHGSASSSQSTWVNALTPRTHTFSYAVGNSYGHPTATAINVLAGAGSTRYDTINYSAEGSFVHLSTTGSNNYTVNGTSYALAGGLKINEGLPAPSSGSEWVEIYNSGSASVSLTGWTLDDIAGAGSAPVSLSGSVAAGGYFVYNYTTSVLNNTGDDIRLINASGVVVDQTTYGSAATGSSWRRSPNGTGAFIWDTTPTKGAANN